MKFCEKCGAYVDEKVRVNGYLICANGHQIEDEATKAIQAREELHKLPRHLLSLNDDIPTENRKAGENHANSK